MANKLIFKNNYKRGLIAEAVAKFWLQLKGYCILERRYRNHHGEIDLIELLTDELYLFSPEKHEDLADCDSEIRQWISDKSEIIETTLGL